MGKENERKKASETTDLVRQNETFTWKNEECIMLFVYLLVKENLYL